MEEEKKEQIEPEKKETEKSQGKKEAQKYILNIFFVLCIAAIAIFFMLKDDYQAVFQAFREVNLTRLLYCFLCMLGYFAIEGLITFAFARLYTTRYHWHQGVANRMIGHFYDALTPSSSGGQFMQAYTFKKQGLEISSAASILVMLFIVNQIVLVLMGAVAMICRFPMISNLVASVTIFDIEFNTVMISVLGFVVNFFVIFGLLLMAYNKKLLNFILGTGINIGAHLHLVHNPEEKRKSLQIQVENFRIELRRLQANIPFTLLAITLIVIKYILYFSMPYLCGMAANAEIQGTWFDGVCFASFLHMITNLIPLPGSAGGAEYFFEKLFYNFFGQNNSILHCANILWRTMTFYLMTVIGGFVSAFYHTAPKQAEQAHCEYKTFVDLQLSTFQERKESSDIAFHTKQISRLEVERQLKETFRRKKRKKKKKNDEEEEK